MRRALTTDQFRAIQEASLEWFDRLRMGDRIDFGNKFVVVESITRDTVTVRRDGTLAQAVQVRAAFYEGRRARVASTC